MTSDDAWMADLRHGAEAAFERLVSQFQGPLYRYFFAAVGDQQLAGELSADCFSELVRAIPKMQGDATQLGSFVYAVARNVLRRRWRRSHRNCAPLSAAVEVADPRAMPDEVAQHREELSQLLCVLQKLDAETREVLLLRYVEHFSLAEVAQITGEPIGTVKSRVHRGRQRLEALLKPSDKT